MKAAYGGNVSLKEWNRKGWTYHAKGWLQKIGLANMGLYTVKGIWVRPTPSSLPTMTLFGSTNLNSRSSNLDTELSFIMTIPENNDKAALALRQKLQDEVQSLKGFAVPWRGESRHVRVGTKVLVGLGVEGML
jgi:CDP-diacylglycerol--glycerol-3-phosphate 3-phosphatidyltransferase